MSSLHQYGKRSLRLLGGCDGRLVVFAYELLRRVPFDLTILPSTIRTAEQQREFLARGTSKTLYSRHLASPSLAVDIAPYVRGRAVRTVGPEYHRLGAQGKALAVALGFDLEYGGDWSWDWAHWQLPWTPEARAYVERLVNESA